MGVNEMDRKTRKQIADLVENHGCHLDDYRSSGKHFVFYLTGPAGNQFVITSSKTPKGGKSWITKLFRMDLRMNLNKMKYA